MPQIVASLTDNFVGIIYEHDMFIVVVNAAFLFFETSKLWALIMYILVE